MKNRNFRKTSIASLLPIAMVVGTLLGVFKAKPQEAKAYTGASLPTTIELNDPSDSTIRNYYSDLNSLSATERKGNNFMKSYADFSREELKNEREALLKSFSDLNCGCCIPCAAFGVPGCCAPCAPIGLF